MLRLAEDFILDFKKIKADRGSWDSHWSDIAKYFYPNKDDVWGSHSAGEKKVIRVYDGSPGHYNELLASALHSMLTNPAVNWFELTSGDILIDRIPEVRDYLQKVTDSIHQALNNSNFQTQIHEVYMDLGTFGTGVLRVLEDATNIATFTSRPIYDYYIKENHKNIVDTCYTEEELTIRQLEQKYGKDVLDFPEAQMIKKDKDHKFKILHAIVPREDSDVGPKNKKFVSVHIIQDYKRIIHKKGFNEFPYMFPRWTKITTEKYGRSPAMTALPDVLMLNAIMRDTIRSAQKVTDPPLMLTDDGLYGPPNTMPGGLNYRRPGSDEIKPLLTQGQPRIGFELITDVRQRVKEAFFIDQLQLREGPQMTATEVNTRVDDQLRLLGPILGRLHFELLQPLINRMVGIFKRKKLLPDNMPKELETVNLQVHYKSQIAKAQRAAEGMNLDRTLMQIGPLIQMSPEVIDVLNPDAIIRYSSRLNDIPEDILNSEEEVSQKRQYRAEQQKAQQEQQEALAGAEVAQKVAPMMKEG